MALRREDHAHALRRGRQRRPLLRADCTFGADAARGGSRRVRMAGAGVHEKAKDGRHLQLTLVWRLYGLRRHHPK